MITKERLAEIKADPREACLFKAEAKELADAYRERVPGLRVTNDADGVWLHFEAPSGKKASISLEALGRSMLGLSPADGGAAAGDFVRLRDEAEALRNTCSRASAGHVKR